ncbi:hypothetical protein C9I99_21710 [Photobacterium lutimaris]|uniref:Uncharacterized protein n=1 Tax=Photobacterium lutimaris TaxID=388278 RepID=A0A2T3ITW8_9GAMM|nr:hypothetical protein C9I99_21710 [Photobacterium lutimaris]
MHNKSVTNIFFQLITRLTFPIYNAVVLRPRLKAMSPEERQQEFALMRKKVTEYQAKNPDIKL